jgi:uncharacterized protein YaiI (UPF0178 family)
MNVIGSRPDGWWKDRDGAMARLVEGLERWAADTGNQVTVVFEKAPAPELHSERVEIAHAPRPGPNAGDQEIVRLLEEEIDPSEATVVTSDRELADRVRKLGGTVEPAAAFRRELAM